MTDNEKAVMTDCYRFLDRFDNPAPKDDPGCEEYWNSAAAGLKELCEKNRHHPLAQKVSIAVYEYLEEKWKAINRKRGIE